jgi:hypothetical protein
VRRVRVHGPRVQLSVQFVPLPLLRSIKYPKRCHQSKLEEKDSEDGTHDAPFRAAYVAFVGGWAS